MCRKSSFFHNVAPRILVFARWRTRCGSRTAKPARVLKGDSHATTRRRDFNGRKPSAVRCKPPWSDPGYHNEVRAVRRQDGRPCRQLRYLRLPARLITMLAIVFLMQSPALEDNEIFAVFSLSVFYPLETRWRINGPCLAIKRRRRQYERRNSPEVNLLIRLSESADMQLEGKPVAEHVLWATSPQSAQRRKFAR